MAKTKKISINSWEKVVNDTYIPTEVIDWHGLELQITLTLSLEDIVEFANSVQKSCFSPETGEYIPIAKDFAIKSNIIDKYTNLTLPDNMERRYDLIYKSDIISVIFQYINFQQFGEIIAAVNDKINNLAQANIEMLTQQANELYLSLDTLQSKMSDLLGNINNDDIANLSRALIDGGVDEEKLVQAYIKNTTGVDS